MRWTLAVRGAMDGSLLSVRAEAPARAEAVLLLKLGFAVGGEGAGDAGVGIGVCESACREGFDGGGGGEDLEDVLGDGDLCGWLRRIGLQLDGGGVALGEQ